MTQSAQQQSLDFDVAARVIATIHRLPASHPRVTPNRKSTATVRGNHRGWFINVDQLQQTLPHFAEELREKAYFSINGYPKNPRSFAKEYVNTLNACYIDIDFHKAGFPKADPNGKLDSPSCPRTFSLSRVEGIIERAKAENVIPPYSYKVFSGHGIWLLWLVDGEYFPQLQMVGEDYQKRLARLKFYQEINIALASKLTTFATEVTKDSTHPIGVLGADKGATDVPRIMRVPTSNNKGKQVAFYAGYESDPNNPAKAKIISYTLKELADYIDYQPAKKKPKNTKTPGVHPEAYDIARKPLTAEERQRAKNSAKGNLTRAAEIELIEAYREGFSDGCRGYALYSYAQLLTLGGLHQSEISAKVYEMAQRCTPRYEDWKNQFESAYKYAKRADTEPRTNKRIADELGVTITEAVALNLRSIRPDYVNTTKRTGKQKTLRKARREALQDIFAKDLLVRPESHKQVMAELGKRNIYASEKTIRNDMKDLGLYTVEQVYQRNIQQTMAFNE